MTRKETKELLPIMQAFAEGKKVEQKIEGLTDWHEVDNDLDISSITKHHIKPEPKYRPFKTQEECWQEMQNHSDFGWVKEKASEMIYNISGISELSIVILEDINSFKEAFDIYQSFRRQVDL